MSYKTRSARRLARKTKRNLILIILITVFLFYIILSWILPNFISAVGFMADFFRPHKKVEQPVIENTSLAPPVLFIPYEATNTAQINIAGYGTHDSQVRIYIDDEAKDTQDVASNGSFLFTDISLNLGTNNIYGKTVNEKGGESLPSKTLHLVYIHDKPQLTVNEPEDNKKIQGGDKKVKVSGKTDPGIKVFVLDTQVIIDKDGNFSLDLPLNEGDNIIVIKAVDSASNVTEVQRRVVFQS